MNTELAKISQKKVSKAHCHNQQSPISQTQIQQKYVHFQTLLMLTKLNSAFFEISLSIRKTFNKIETKYSNIKFKAFFTLFYYKSQSFQLKVSNQFFTEFQTDKNNNEDEIQSNFIDEILAYPKLKNKRHSLKLPNQSTLEEIMFENTRRLLVRVMWIMKNKQKGLLSFSFYQIVFSRQYSNLKINSEKSSKIDTVDSNKNKIFRRSWERQISRKSYSVQKPINSSQNPSLVPIKCQPTVKIPQKNSGSNDQSNSPQLSIILNPNAEQDHRKELANNFMPVNRDRKNLNSESSKISSSLMINEKQQVINELEYLKRKFKKLVAEFNLFSQRFLKVIDEQQWIK